MISQAFTDFCFRLIENLLVFYGIKWNKSLNKLKQSTSL